MIAGQRLLGEAARARLLGLLADEREVLRHATLGPEDLALVAQRRGQPKQLGFALILVCLRYAARVLEANELPPPALLVYLAQQLDVDAGTFAVYAQCNQTRRTHLAKLTRRLGLLPFDRAAFHAMVDWALQRLCRKSYAVFHATPMLLGSLAAGCATAVEVKGSHFEREIVLWGARWYVAYSISYRQLEDLMEERGVEVDHSSLSRWVLKYVPLLEQAFRACKRRVGGSWRMDETYVRIRGQWRYLYRAVDKAGNTVDFLLTAKRDRNAALRFLCKAHGQHGAPAKFTIDMSGANAAAIESCNLEHDTEIELRQVKYLNKVVEQDHRAIKRQVRPMMGFKSFWSAAVTLAVIELMHMIRKGQLKAAGCLHPAQQFQSRAS